MQISSLNNIFSKQISLNNNFSSPVSFRGSPVADTFESSLKKDELASIEKNLRAFEKRCGELKRLTEEKYGIYTQAHSACIAAIDKMSGIRRGVISVTSDEEALAKDDLSKKSSACDRARTVYNKTQREYKDALRKLDGLRLYFEQYKKDPSFAFIFNPNLSETEKRALAPKKQVYPLRKLADILGLDEKIVMAWYKSGLIETLKMGDSLTDTFVPLQSKANKPFFDEIQSKDRNFTGAEKLMIEYNIPEGLFKRYVESGKIKGYGFEGNLPIGVGALSLLVDLNDETTLNALNDHGKLYPKPSIYQSDRSGVPAFELQKLGFGPVRNIKELINKGYLEGNIQKIDTKSGPKTRTTVNLYSTKAQDILSALRSSNPDIMEYGDFAKALGLTQSALQEALLNDEAQIIPEYLFADDYSKRFFDLKNPINKDFIDRALFEAKLKEELKLKNKREKLEGYAKFQSLKMALAWNFCPKTRQIASDLASGDNYLCRLLAKEDEGEEELTTKEKIKVNSFRKRMWQEAGTDELKSAIKKAGEIIELYSNGDFDSIPNDALDLIKQYEGA